MFENQTYESILQRMLDRVSDSLDKREGSVIWDTHSPTALEFQNLYLELENMLQEAYGDTASREFLIRRAKERGITPYSATNAILKGEFTPKDIDVLGKRFNLQELNYVVTEKIADGTYRVECETEGAVGNQYLGSVIPIEYIDGLETADASGILHLSQMLPMAATVRTTLQKQTAFMALVLPKLQEYGIVIFGQPR